MIENNKINNEDISVVVLAGGLGSRIRNI